MKRQKDWFTGINYYDNYLENQIIVEQKTVSQPTQMKAFWQYPTGAALIRYPRFREHFINI